MTAGRIGGVEARNEGTARAVCSALTADTVRRLVAGRTLVRITVRGRSMSPAVLDGDRVVIGPLAGQPARGDLLVVRSGDGLGIRRLVDRPSEDVLFATGGEGSRRGTPVAESAVIGRVEAVERNGRIVAPGPPRSALRRWVWATRAAMRRAAG